MQLRRTQKEAVVDERTRDRIPHEETDVDAVLAALSNGVEKSREEPAAAVTRTAVSLIDRQSSFDGQFRTEKDLRIEGTAAGQIHCGGTLTVEREATVKAKVETRDLVVRGRIEGDVSCSGRAVLASTAVVSGSLKAATLVVEEGASLSATVEVVPSVRPAAATPPPPDRVAERPPEPAPVGAIGAPPAEFPSRPGSRSRSAPSFSLVSTEER
ncbi:hypothetical protein HRbin29_00683 [bacterium HR29]|jgi:cytoskeletal protein CcmA (bactofilin family)|nr:hypothetical protein HRbin29_00683 [bacterium HR29]